MIFRTVFRSTLFRHFPNKLYAFSNSFHLGKILMQSKSMFSAIERGSPNTKNYRLYFSDGSSPISPFHDIPMFSDKTNGIYNMVVEIPRWTNAKMEIATKEPLNPIKQDTKKGELRYVANVFPHHGYIWNYGAIPQTWEDPNTVCEHTQCKGDNDPIDVLEIGTNVAGFGDVLQVKVLGILGVIDEGETDWKVIAVNVEDPLVEQLNDVSDIEKVMPGLLRATQEWFIMYKIPDGKPKNKLAFNGEAKDKAFAEKIIKETHEAWEKLVNNPDDSSGLSCVSVFVESSPHKIGVVEASSIVDQSPPQGSAEVINDNVDYWHFVKQ